MKGGLPVAGRLGWCSCVSMTGLNLPKKCGVMLLPECTLFPHGGLPLYIFEERYRAMLLQALEGDCVFSVGRLRERGDGEEPEISPVGTAGLVRACRRRDDGTSELLLHGVIRVRFSEWLEDEPFPCALIEPVLCEPLDPARDKAAIATIKGAVEDCLVELPEEVRAGVMSLMDQADEAGLLTDLVAQQLVHDGDLRQRLLETVSVGERVATLCGFLDKIRPAT